MHLHPSRVFGRAGEVCKRSRKYMYLKWTSGLLVCGVGFKQSKVGGGSGGVEAQGIGRLNLMGLSGKMWPCPSGKWYMVSNLPL